MDEGGPVVRPASKPDQPKPDYRPDSGQPPSSRPAIVPTPEPPEAVYTGASRFWYPALGISVRWNWYGCEQGGDPDGLGAGLYRWDCAGSRNVYLMSHAWSTFAALRRGYHSGRVQVGQTVWYSSPSGEASQWRIKWIKRVDVEYFMRTFDEWASVSSSTPVMTLQTCDGRRNQFRLIVRLVPSR